MEKGLRSEETPAFIKDTTLKHGWKHFYAPLIAVLTELVREFYANFDLNCTDHIVIRETEVN